MKKNLLSLLIIFLSVLCGSSKLSAQSSGTWGGIDWTLTDDGTLTIAPTVHTITKKKPWSGELYQVGEWPAAVNDALTSVTGWPYNRTKVKKLIIEEGITSIGSFAGQLPNLEGEIVIPSTVKYVGQECFKSTKKVNGTSVSANNVTKLTFAKGGTEKLIIAHSAFAYLSNEELVLPDDRPEIDINCWAFSSNPNLKYVTLPANIKDLKGSNHLDYENNDAAEANVSWKNTSDLFTGCSNLKSITFENATIKDLYNKYNSSGSTPSYLNQYHATITSSNPEIIYAKIDEAIANWKDGTTLTLLKNVTLSNVVTIKSKEQRTLNLSKYTLTAANGQNAIQINTEGEDGSTSRNCLTINADATTPGSISSQASCIYYKDNNDSFGNGLTVEINGGIFKGKIVSNKTFYITNATLDLTSVEDAYTYNGVINLPNAENTFTTIFNEGKIPYFENQIRTNVEGKGVTYTETNSEGIVTRIYSICSHDDQNIAGIDNTHYPSLLEAYEAAIDNDVIYIIKDFEAQQLDIEKNISIDLCGFTASTNFSNPNGTVTLKNGTIIVGDNAITNNGTLNLNNITITGNGSNIVLKGNGTTTISSTCNITDGYLEYYDGELFNQSTNIPAIAKKDFDGIGAVQGQTGWSTISTPIANAAIPEATAGIHDLYRFDEPEQEWEYYNDADGQTFKKLELGRGYLYTNSHDITFQLEGNLNAASVSYPLSYTEGNSLKGFNMIGNPFTHTISESNLSTSATLAEGFYVVGANGSWTAKADGKIAPMESVLIQADAAENLTIAPSTPNNGSKRAARNENSYLTINVASKTHSDVAYVSFNDGMGLDKINHRNPDNPMLYIPVEGKNYAVAVMNKDVKEVPVYFNANRMAEYTISIEQKNCEFSSVVLVDKLTGIETNMLIEDYTFMARTFDDANRFVIRMSIEDNDDSETENFAYVSNGSIVIEKIEGNANIRIFDIMGRHIMGTNATGNANIPVETMSTGMYIIQMSDDNGVKVQKIIIE